MPAFQILHFAAILVMVAFSSFGYHFVVTFCKETSITKDAYQAAHEQPIDFSFANRSLNILPFQLVQPLKFPMCVGSRETRPLDHMRLPPRVVVKKPFDYTNRTLEAFFHVSAWGDWRMNIQDQLTQMVESKLCPHLRMLHVGLIGLQTDEIALRSILCQFSRVCAPAEILFRVLEKQSFELPTLQALRKRCRGRRMTAWSAKSPAPDAVLYFHNKGSSQAVCKTRFFSFRCFLPEPTVFCCAVLLFLVEARSGSRLEELHAVLRILSPRGLLESHVSQERERARLQHVRIEFEKRPVVALQVRTFRFPLLFER